MGKYNFDEIIDRRGTSCKHHLIDVEGLVDNSTSMR